jgi:hypothetical protein
MFDAILPVEREKNQIGKARRIPVSLSLDGGKGLG